MDEKETPEKKNPFGEGIKPAMYILFDEAKGNFFLLGAPGFLDDPVRAYGALKIAERNLDDFYSKKLSIRERIISGVKNFQAREGFRRFIRER